jgi:hypothetical protein
MNPKNCEAIAIFVAFESGFCESGRGTPLGIDIPLSIVAHIKRFLYVGHCTPLRRVLKKEFACAGP